MCPVDLVGAFRTAAQTVVVAVEVTLPCCHSSKSRQCTIPSDRSPTVAGQAGWVHVAPLALPTSTVILAGTIPTVYGALFGDCAQ